MKSPTKPPIGDAALGWDPGTPEPVFGATDEACLAISDRVAASKPHGMRVRGGVRTGDRGLARLLRGSDRG